MSLTKREVRNIFTSEFNDRKVEWNPDQFYIDPVTGFLSINPDLLGGTPKLATPELTVAPASSSSITASWADVANESNYELQRSADGSTGWTTINSPAANAVSYSDTGLVASTEYFYRLRAVGDGTTFLNSNWSTIVSATTSASSADDPFYDDAAHYFDFIETSGDYIDARGTEDLVVSGTVTRNATPTVGAQFGGGFLKSANPTSIGKRLSGGAYTITMWLRKTGSSSNNNALKKNAGGQLQAIWGTGVLNVTVNSSSSSFTYTLNEWFMVTVISNTVQTKFRFNNNAITASPSSDPSAYTASADSDADFSIAGDENGGYATPDMEIRMFRQWNRELTEAELDYEYNSGLGRVK